jgi:hypothetical protein
MEALEFYKFLGATFGFVSGGFAIWDRMFRYRPSVSLTTESLPARPQLRIKNQAPFDIIIEEIFCSLPKHYRVLAADTVHAAVFDALDRHPPVLLAPGEERRLAIVERNTSELADDLRFKFKVTWTRGDHPFFRPAAVSLWSSPKDIANRQQAADLWSQEQRYAGTKTIPGG